MKRPAPLVLAIVLVAFTIFSTVIVMRHGYFGFITVALREPWALQMLLDLSIALFIVGGWLRRDARAHGIDATPYLLTLPLLGSISPLAYLVHRGLKPRP